jgi:hypothetical protein
MHFETFIPKDRGEQMFRADWGGEIDTRDLWEERFNSHTDPKPHGPAAVGLDVFFPNANVLSGLPSRTVPLNLPATRGNGVEGKEPYRMFNLDVFEYALNHNMGLYVLSPLTIKPFFRINLIPSSVTALFPSSSLSTAATLARPARSGSTQLRLSLTSKSATVAEACIS